MPEISELDRIDTTLQDVLAAILIRLRLKLAMNDRTCFLWLAREILPPPPAPADVIVTIEPDAGRFDEGLVVGGDRKQFTVETGVAISVHSLIRLDSGNRDDQVLMDQTRGATKVMLKVIDALAGHDLLVGGKPCLRAPLSIQGFDRPRRLEGDDGEVRLIWTLLCPISFDWNLP